MLTNSSISIFTNGVFCAKLLISVVYFLIVERILLSGENEIVCVYKLKNSSDINTLTSGR